MQSETAEMYDAQSALQQQQLDSQASMYAPQLHEQMQQSQAVLVAQTDPKKVVRNIMLRLRGLEEKDNGDLIPVAEPKVNKMGIDNIWFILDSHINQNVILSRLVPREIANIMDNIQEDLVDDLSLNWKEYGIKKKTDLDTINNAVLTNIYLALKRAEGQNEKNWLSKISVENISGSARPTFKQSEGFWSKFRL